MLERLREDRAVTRRLSFPYVLALPQDYDALPDKRWPLVVMLHGAGERGDDYDVLCRHGFLRRAAAGRNSPSFWRRLNARRTNTGAGTSSP